MDGWKDERMEGSADEGKGVFPCSPGYHGDERRSIHTNELQLENNGHT